uniref:Uncharacterized protein n=1 Tax=Utricularia reniformis TaxID=192314 RepID=A0A1Y0B1H4_9LAMI|nr:hypothetical protein AEK19_MT1019 [Utricularia reniformis]ART31241.1 hypothetical protein AEK19_MT1019 [Utricularia reniformis]
MILVSQLGLGGILGRHPSCNIKHSPTSNHDQLMVRDRVRAVQIRAHPPSVPGLWEQGN